MSRETVAKEVGNWLVSGNTGLSSIVMAGVALGASKGREYCISPSDPSDFNRCLMFLRDCPSAKAYMNEIAELSPAWKSVIENWDELERCLTEEVGEYWSKTFKGAPKTYKFMKKLGC